MKAVNEPHISNIFPTSFMPIESQPYQILP